MRPWLLTALFRTPNASRFGVSEGKKAGRERHGGVMHTIKNTAVCFVDPADDVGGGVVAVDGSSVNNASWSWLMPVLRNK